MTRPMYEPSLPRTDAVLGFGSDQLFRRPRPDSEVAVELARCAAAITTSAIDYVEPDFLAGTNATFERTSNTIFDVNGTGRLVILSGNPGVYLFAASAHDVDGDAGSDSYINYNINWVAPRPVLYAFPGWFDSGFDGGSVYDVFFPLYLDAASNGTQLEPIPWTQTLYNDSSEDLVIKLGCAIIKDGSFEASNSLTALLSLVRLGDAPAVVLP